MGVGEMGWDVCIQQAWKLKMIRRSTRLCLEWPCMHLKGPLNLSLKGEWPSYTKPGGAANTGIPSFALPSIHPFPSKADYAQFKPRYRDGV